jgi:16S rRNA (guanine527-N7)-methyltransferase
MEIILKYFPALNNIQQKQFESLLPLYAEWNSKINVISRKDIDQLYERHVLHSLSIAKIIDFKKGTQILDVGTGGGFPGIPLAIMFPEANFHLVDSIGKKIKVVDEVAAEIGLKNLSSEHSRAENVKGKFDFIVSRAVTRLPDFHQWVSGKVKPKSKNSLPNGILYLKGGDFSDEIKQIKTTSKVYELSEFFSEAFFETKKLIHLFQK